MENSENESFEELFNESIKNDSTLEKIVTGTIIEITSKGEIFVDLGYKADGIIPRKEYSFNMEDDPRDEFKVGDTITAEVVKMNDGTGNVLLSYKRNKISQGREKFAQSVSAGEIFESKINQINEKGIVTEVNGVRVFIPLSLSGIRKEDKLESYQGKNIQYKVIEFDPENRKVIGSNRIIEDERKQKLEADFWNNIEVGKEFTGKVATVNPYGVFVDLGNVHGLLHVSEITWRRNANAGDFIKEGETITVVVKEFDKENKKVQLSYPNKEANPWNFVSEKYHLNDVVNVTVKKFMPFGAFVELEDGVEGLVHISQICDERIAKPEDKLQIGQKLDAKIIDMDLEKKKIELSIREVNGANLAEEVKDIEGITFEKENNE